MVMGVMGEGLEGQASRHTKHYSRKSTSGLQGLTDFGSMEIPDKDAPPILKDTCIHEK